MKIFSTNDYEILNNNIKDLELKSEIEQLQKIEPTLNERLQIIQIILDFIKKKKIIIYGGYAIHIYLDNTIYDIKYRFPDIDIYSTDAINDMIELSDIIKKKNPEKNIIFKEAFHKDTFSLFVNYINYLDITFISKNILKSLKLIKKNNFILIHPSLIMLDIFRQFNDPLISYWRLNKNITRFKLLNKKYNFLNYFDNLNIYNLSSNLYKLNKFIYNKIKQYVNTKKSLFTGFYAYQLFTKKKFTNILYFEIISTDYINDVNFYFLSLQKDLPDLKKESYYPFFQYLNKKTIFYSNNKIILIIYDSNNKCIPFIKYKNEYFVSYMYFIQMTFSLYLYYIYTNEDILKDKMKKMILDCLLAKNIFFDKNKDKNILDETIFQQFIINCKGKTSYTNIEFLKNLESKNKNLKLKRFNYIPQKDKPLKKKIKYIYENTTGMKM